MSFSYYTEQKKLIEESCANNIHTGENVFSVATTGGLWIVSFQTEQKTCLMLWLVWIFLAFLEKRKPHKYCWKEVNYLFFRGYLVWCAKMWIYYEKWFKMLAVFLPTFVVDKKIFSYNFGSPVSMYDLLVDTKR